MNIFFFALKEFDRLFDLKKYSANYSFVNPIPLLNESEKKEWSSLVPIITIFPKNANCFKSSISSPPKFYIQRQPYAINF